MKAIDLFAGAGGFSTEGAQAVFRYIHDEPVAPGVNPCEGCKPRPLCRDCADNDGTCPNDGLPCNPKERHTCSKYAAGVQVGQEPSDA